MPWHTQAMKDVARCDKLREGVSNRYHPQISEWGNPSSPFNFDRAFARPELNGRDITGVNKIALVKRTRGTETSQYPEEKTSTEIPLVVASESGPGQCLVFS